MQTDAADIHMLAFDHRADFERLFGIEGRRPTHEEIRRLRWAKTVIFEGFRVAVEDGAGAESGAVLIDPAYGDDVARLATETGTTLALSVERPGTGEFDFEFGDGFADHLERHSATCVKAMFLHHPDGDPESGRRQIRRLRRLSDWLHAHGREFLLELIVTPRPHDLDAVGGDVDRFRTEIRPHLVMRSIGELQAAGVEPHVWKLQGMTSRNTCAAVVDEVRRDGRSATRCVVLGAGASDDEVESWLATVRDVPGFAGFAIGRSIFAGPIRQLASGRIERDAAVNAIAGRYRRFVDVHRGVR
jgi:myo-inositol catabolism protein IolC